MSRIPRRIVVLTGAGISAESGLRTFRGADGLWENHSVVDVATPEAFRKDPSLVHRFYSERRRQLRAAQPNDAHRALAQFAQQVDGRLFLVTQNIDDLHERASSPQVHHMHGELMKMRCEVTGDTFAWEANSSPQSVCPCCSIKGRLRPHVVWFGEIPFGLDEIQERLRRCDLFVSIGTSGNVYPAAGFFDEAKRHGAETVELNLEPSQNASSFDDGDYGPATETVPRFFKALLERLSGSRER